MTVGELLLNLNVVGSRQAVKDIDKVLGSIKKVSDIIKTTGGSMKTLGDSVNNVGTIFTNVGKAMTNYITKPLLGVGLVSVKTAMGFDRQMSKVQAVTRSTGRDFITLRKLAIEMGSKTTKTATEAAEAIEYMGLAGWDLTKIQKALEPILRASEAGVMDLGETSDLVTDSMSALGIGVDDLGRYLDIAAEGSVMSNMSLKQFLKTMMQAGGTFDRLNTPLEEAGALIGILAEKGYKGKQAGNALITIMKNLTLKSGQSGKAMKELGIETYDTNGKFRGISVILKDLNKKFATLTDEQRDTYIQMIGGATRTKELDALLKGTSTSLDGFTKRLYNSKGALSKMASTMQKNLHGQITKLKSILEGIAIAIGDLLMPIISFFVSKLQKLSEWFFKLNKFTKAIILIFGGLLASIGPIVTIIGTLITAIGLVIGGIAGLITLIGTVGLPVIAAVIAGLVGFVAQTTIVIGIIGLVTAAVGGFLAKLGFLQNGIKTISSLLSGDFNKIFTLLSKTLGMNEKSALKLSNSFVEMYRKAKVVITVIRNNLIPLFKLLKDKVVTAFSSINGSTKASQNFFINFVKRITNAGEKIFGYLYKVFDEFGLIPTKLKFTNNKIAAEFVELNAKTSANLDNIINSQYIFGKNLTSENLKIYNKKMNDTVNSMNQELQLVLTELNKRKNTELTALQNLFNESAVLTSVEEAKRIEKFKQYYTQEQTELTNNNARIKEIMTQASNEKRALTSIEVQTINNLRRDSKNKAIGYVSTSQAEQIRIMEESKNLKTAITKSEAMIIITEANRAYDKVVEKARKQKNDKINAIIQQRDGVGVISRDEADKMIREAQRESHSVIEKARDTKNKTISHASKKAGGVISEADREKRGVTTQADKIKSVLLRIWSDIKAKLPQYTREAINGVAAAIIANKGLIISKAFEVGAALVGGLISGIGSRIGRLMSKISKLTSIMSVGINIPRFATGVRNFVGGLALVGEQGPELVNLPKGSNVYTAGHTRRLLPSKPIQDIFNSSLKSRFQNNQATSIRGVNNNVLIKIDASNMSVDQLGTALVSKLRSYGIKPQTQ